MRITASPTPRCNSPGCWRRCVYLLKCTGLWIERAQQAVSRKILLYCCMLTLGAFEKTALVFFFCWSTNKWVPPSLKGFIIEARRPLLVDARAKMPNSFGTPPTFFWDRLLGTWSMLLLMPNSFGTLSTFRDKLLGNCVGACKRLTPLELRPRFLGTSYSEIVWD